MTTALSASNAYSSAAQVLQRAEPLAPETAELKTPDFSNILGVALEQGEIAARTSHTTVASVADGQANANLVDVVTAVAETEVALQTMVSVRDRVISAYQEIMRMPI